MTILQNSRLSGELRRCACGVCFAMQLDKLNLTGDDHPLLTDFTHLDRRAG